tara:strand:- start:1821 stop:1961 length:141 start_codon:yes stop_codon:yes gene_type:complete
MSDVDFVVNDDGTPMQDNSTGVDVDGDSLGHSSDDSFSDDSFSDEF